MRIHHRVTSILIGFVLTLSMIGTVTVTAPQDTVQAQTEAQVRVDGELLQTDVAPVNRNGYLLVPLRAIFEALEADVSWEGTTKTAFAKRNGQQLQITVDSPVAFVNTDPTILDTPAELVDNRVMVPLRFVSENLDGTVRWDNALKTAFINMNDEADTIPPVIEDILAVVGGNVPAIEPTEDESYPKSKQQIRQMWQQYQPLYNGTPYVREPQLAAPYETGLLKKEFIEDGLLMTNFVRYLAGLPHDLKLDPRWNEQAQYGAVLLAANGVLTHTPTRPDDMSKTFYDKGLQSTMSSNIASYAFMTTDLKWDGFRNIFPEDDLSLAQTVKQYMKDEDLINLPHVGHRRWILNPPLQSIGFGYADQLVITSEQLKLSRYSTMQVFDTSRSQPFDYEYIAWPAEGYFPVEFFGATQKRGSDPWSVTLNPEKYARPELDEVHVRLTRVSDGASWTLNKQDYRTFGPADMGYAQSFVDAYFTVDQQRIGVPNAIIFRPELTENYQPGEKYRVEISGIQTKDGAAATIDFSTEFFALQ